MAVPKGGIIFKLVDSKAVGVKLREARIQANLSLDAVSNMGGIASTTLSRIELGQQKFYAEHTKDKVAKLASALLPSLVLDFQRTDWRTATRRKRARKLAPVRVQAPDAPTDHVTVPGMDATVPAASPEGKFALAMALLKANQSGALTPEQTRELLGEVLK
jgi:transcriptional regulator with XRE-family HTH domain